MPQIFVWLGLNYIELIGAVAGIIGVWLTARQLIWCWPVALVNVVIYIYIFFIAKLYADFGLQLFYLVMTLYGWYNWHYGGKNHEQLRISKIPLKLFSGIFVLGILAQTLLGYLLKNYSDASFPYIDSFVSIWGIIGTFMMAKKIIEHWIVWIIVDIFSVGIFFLKDLYATSVLYLIFTILAVYGWIKWNRDYKLQTN
jgi:nicotinamide mononucleotide transporter